MKVKSASAQPAQKVVAASVGSAIATLLIVIIEQSLKSQNISFESGSIQGLEMALTVLITFIAGYIVPPGKNDQIEIIED